MVTKEFLNNSYLYVENAGFIEELYEKYLQNPSGVSSEWHVFFKENSATFPHPSWYKKPKPDGEEKHIKKEEKPAALVNNSLEHLRLLGHLACNLDPLGIDNPKTIDELSIEPCEQTPLYTGTTGVEFSYVSDFKEQEWLYTRFEQLIKTRLSNEEKIHILQDLVEVEGLEQYIHKKFPGAKRFSVEGGDSSIVATEYAIDQASKYGVEEVVIGMAHRGRLNTLTKVLGKPYEAILAEFMGKYSFPKELGVQSDVKYHMGYSNDITTNFGHKVHLTLTPNPSHLEAVNPVVAGRVRAKQDLLGDRERNKVMALLVHGDAAFCGQGIVAESLMLSTLVPYDIGGIFHIVINNQVGFTANPIDGHKSSRYSTDFAKIIGAPIIHVNGDDPEAVTKATVLLSEYRTKFKKDVILEIICYRKYGHNEGDEPMYTQPVMYNIIKQKKTTAHIYADRLVSESTILDSDYEARCTKFKEKMDKSYELAKIFNPQAYFLDGVWKGFSREKTDLDKKLNTGVSKTKLLRILQKLCTIPEGFNVNPKLVKLFDERVKNFKDNDTFDWATGEQLAFATLLEENIPIRITGQDASRGTFSHRHSVLHDQNTGSRYVPLNCVSDKQANYEVADSCLSEYGVLGFEFGYSMSHPKSLVIWEAQFGDFSNGAQIIFDQFLSATETKWLRLVGLVLLLPHGYEGQGPEHTSARLERLLQLCADNNMQVCYPTTPASIYHVLRRQMLRQVRKPLIIMSPKSVFRNPLAVSHTKEISDNTRFLHMIPDDLDPKKVKRVVICSGKVYYDLLAKRIADKKNDIALIRIEQLYPFPVDVLNKELDKYKSADLIWCQEEPENMGAWNYINSRIAKELKRGSEIKVVSRKEAASPATGYLSVHQEEQNELVNKAINF